MSRPWYEYIATLKWSPQENAPATPEYLFPGKRVRRPLPTSLLTIFDRSVSRFSRNTANSYGNFPTKNGLFGGVWSLGFLLYPMQNNGMCLCGSVLRMQRND